MRRLSLRTLPRYGRVWSAARSASDLSRLAREVHEYFALGLEVPRGATVVDVGAHCGLFAMEVAARADDVSIVAVEPIPVFHEALRRNFEENPHLMRARARSRIVNAGIARDGAETEAEFAYFARLPTDTTRYVEGKYDEFERVFATHARTFEREISKFVPGVVGRSVASAAHAVVAGIPRGGIRGWLFDRAIGVERVRCAMTTLARVLDDAARPIDVLKIDVEGAELDVLMGARDEQWSQIRQVVLEGTGQDGTLARIRAMLSERGLAKQAVAEPFGASEQGLDSFLLLATR